MSVSATEEASACRQLRAGEPFVGKQGLQYAVGISAESVTRVLHPTLRRIDRAVVSKITNSLDI